MQVTKGTWRMREQCVPGSFSSSHAREPGNEASKCYDSALIWDLPLIYVYICIMLLRKQCLPSYVSSTSFTVSVFAWQPQLGIILAEKDPFTLKG